ncbi:MAG: dihydroorotase [Aigarchaeota archaeon]|nr:dihydroorotase [Aigarchaeota archaeon]MDH5702690.1 dihydroorotase [Aigarchaeota archaeon]
MPVDLKIVGGTLVTAGGLVRAGLAVDEGRIVEIERESSLPPADETIDASRQFVLPGVIDAHAHIDDPKYVGHEDFRSGTEAAASGGVTTVIDMPLETPFVTPRAIDEKIEACERLAVVDFALTAGMMTIDRLRYVDEVVRRGVVSFKAFTCSPYRLTYPELRAVAKKVGSMGAVLHVHAEDEATVAVATKRARARGSKPKVYPSSRPPEAEVKAVRRVLAVTASAGAHIHFAHLSTGRSSRAVLEAKSRGLPVSCETCPHYLAFSKKDMVRCGPYLKMNPPLRSAAEREVLWKALRLGAVDIVTSEHAPGTSTEKEVGWDDIWKAWSGVPGIETMLPFLLSEGVNRSRISLQRLVTITSRAPATIFGLSHRKGAIRVGLDADLILVNLRKTKAVSTDELHSKVKRSPFEGMRLKGWPTTTLVRGRIVWREGEILGRPGCGTFVAARTR